MINPDFSLQDDIIGLTDMRNNLAEIVSDVADNHAQKVVIRNGKPAMVLVNVADFQALQDRLLAVELETLFKLALEEEKRGELIPLETLAAKYGFKREDFDLEAMHDEQG